MYRCEGAVSDAAAFLQRNLDVLSSQEREWLTRHEWRPSRMALPSEITSNCLTINPDWTDEQPAVFKARRSGDRSAYWAERSLKVKGCNPVLEEQKTFPFQVASVWGNLLAAKGDSLWGAVRRGGSPGDLWQHALPASQNPREHGAAADLRIYEVRQAPWMRDCTGNRRGDTVGVLP